MTPKNTRGREGVSPTSKLHAARILRARHPALTTVVNVENISTPIVSKAFVDLSIAVVIGFIASLRRRNAGAQHTIAARCGPHTGRAFWTFELACHRKMLTLPTATAPSARNA